jgi:hypothetical protein
LTVVRQRRGWRELFLVLAVEVAGGFLSFFSDFKMVLVVVFLAVLSVPGVFRGRAAVLAAALASIALALGLVWTTIKMEYRNFMNQNTREQVVRVSASEQATELARLLGDLSAQKLEVGIEDFVNRLSYVYFFAETLEFVPRFLPHEDGALWLDAFTRSVIPRALDPDKEVLDASARTAKYTGLLIIGGDESTSVSLGYIAESYIDFGSLGMMPALFLWGLFLGRLVRTLTRGASNSPTGDACATVLVVLNAAMLEQSNAGMVGGVLTTFVVFWVLERYYLQRAMRLFAQRSRAGALAIRPATPVTRT